MKRSLLTSVCVSAALLTGCATSRTAMESVQASAPVVKAEPAPALKLSLNTVKESAESNERRFVERISSRAPRRRTLEHFPAEGDSDELVELNFQGTPVKEVAGFVLGDVLGRNYVVDSGIDDRITITTPVPVTRSEILPLFNAVLASRSLAIQDMNGILRVSRFAGSTPPPVPGGAVDAHRLRHVKSEDLAKIMETVVPASRIRTVPGQDELLLISGTPEERRLAREAIAAFDVDSMSGMSSLFVSLEQASAEKVAGELEDIFGKENQGPGGGSIRFLPIDRLNAIVVLAKSDALLDRAYDWVMRLDRTQVPNAKRLYVYNLQNRKATDLIAPLQDLLGEGILSEALDVAPGAEAAIAASELTGGGDAQPVRRRQADDLRVVVDAQNNALLISATPERYLVVRDLIKQLDVVPRQVLIEVMIIEVSLSDDLRYGVQFALRTGGIDGFEDSTVAFSDTATGLPVAPTLPGFAFFLSDNGGPEVILEALARNTNVNVVSSPKIVVQDNAKAQLQVGDSVPIIVQQSTNTNAATGSGANASAIISNSVVYRDTGVLLEVTPQVSNGGLVNLEITQEVSDVSRTTSSTINSPTISQRRLTTNVAVQNAQTVMLGGLIQKREEVSRGGIPILKDIPLLGRLFSNNTSNDRRTELIALMTPSVIENPAEGQAVTDRMKRKFRALTDYYSDQ